MSDSLHAIWTDEDYARNIPGASKAMPYGAEENQMYDEYPTVIYTMDGEPTAISSSHYANALRFALRARAYADSTPRLIFTKRYWSIG